MARSTRGKYLSPPDNVTDLARLFLNWEEFNLPLMWFDCELSRLLGVDVLDLPFYKRTGWEIHHLQQNDLLLLKSETTDDVKREALSTFLGVDVKILERVNNADDKQYGSSYKDFIDQVRMPPEHVNNFFKARYVQRFYSEAEMHRAASKFGAQMQPQTLPR